MPGLLTIKEIAKQLQVPESNVRYYRDRFEDYIPSVGEGRRRRYKKEAVDVFSHIVQGYREEKNTDQIASELASMFPRNVHINDDGKDMRTSGDSNELMASEPNRTTDDSSLAVLQAQSRTLEHLAQALAGHSSLASEFTRLRQEQERLKKGLVHVWRAQKNALGESYAEGNPDIKDSSLHQQVQGLEKRLQVLEQCMDREIKEMRSQVKECLDVTREFLRSAGDDV
ncbi:MAG: MerR family transcriptional regulator [Desulfovermiculus sp.]|nr:MerR family transcriptional regulator [Desulfovermiculus sp.]